MGGKMGPTQHNGKNKKGTPQADHQPVDWTGPSPTSRFNQLLGQNTSVLSHCSINPSCSGPQLGGSQVHRPTGLRARPTRRSQKREKKTKKIKPKRKGQWKKLVNPSSRLLRDTRGTWGVYSNPPTPRGIITQEREMKVINYLQNQIARDSWSATGYT